MIRQNKIKIDGTEYLLRTTEVFNHDSTLTILFSSKDILNLLQYKSNNIKNLCINITLIDYYELIFQGYRDADTKGEYFIPTNELILLITKSTKLTDTHKKSIIEQLKEKDLIDTKEYIPIVKTKPEIQFLDILGHICNFFRVKYIKQYKVGNYYVDFYINILNVCIEYDEKAHKYYDIEKEKKRQEYIESVLRCKFIRVSDNYSDGENIEYVLNRLRKI